MLKNSVRLITLYFFVFFVFFYVFNIYFDVKMTLKVRLKTLEFKIISQKINKERSSNFRLKCDCLVVLYTTGKKRIRHCGLVQG